MAVRWSQNLYEQLQDHHVVWLYTVIIIMFFQLVCTLHYGCHMKIKNCLFSLSLPCSSKVFSGVRVAPSLVFCVLFCRSLIVIHLLGGIISLKGRVCSCKSSLIPSLYACIKPCQWPYMHMSARGCRFNLCLYDGLLDVVFFLFCFILLFLSY